MNTRRFLCHSWIICNIICFGLSFIARRRCKSDSARFDPRVLSLRCAFVTVNDELATNRLSKFHPMHYYHYPELVQWSYPLFYPYLFLYWNDHWRIQGEGARGLETPLWAAQKSAKTGQNRVTCQVWASGNSPSHTKSWLRPRMIDKLLIDVICFFEARNIILREDASTDAITGLEQKTRYGKPEWNKVFENIAQAHPKWVYILYLQSLSNLSLNPKHLYKIKTHWHLNALKTTETRLGPAKASSWRPRGKFLYSLIDIVIIFICMRWLNK